MKNLYIIHPHIYITSDEKIKDGDWHLEKGQILNKFPNYLTDLSECKKIILTTDPNLINDGVQVIDDEFLKWFTDNLSCEYVDVKKEKALVGWEPDYTYENLGIYGSKNVYQEFYKIITLKQLKQ